MWLQVQDARAAALATVQDCVALCILTIQPRNPETLPRLARTIIQNYVADSETRVAAQQDMSWHNDLVQQGWLPKFENGMSKMKPFALPEDHAPLWAVGTVQGSGSGAGRANQRATHVRVQTNQLD